MYNKLSKKDNKDFKMLLISQDYVRKELIKIIDDFLKNLDHKTLKEKLKLVSNFILMNFIILHS